MQLYTVLQSSPCTGLAIVFVVIVVILSVMVETRSYNNGLIFYDPQTRNLFLPPTVSVARGRSLAGLKYSEKGSIWSTFGKPCDCAGAICSCCAGIKVKQYNFDQKMCANVTFLSQQREALLEIFLNDKPSALYGISARNPSPFCIPVMLGVPMAMCVQMSDVALMDNNLNMCMDFIVRLATTDLFEMHFQCMRMGADGLQYLDKNGKPLLTPGQRRQITKDERRSDEEVDEYEYYDESEKSGEDIDSSENKLESDDNEDAVHEVGANEEGMKKAATALVNKSENGNNYGNDNGNDDYNADGDGDNDKELLDVVDNENDKDGDAKSNITQQTALRKATDEKLNGKSVSSSATKSAVNYMNNLKNAMNSKAITTTMPPGRTTATAKTLQTTTILTHAAAANVAASEEAAATAASMDDELADDEVVEESQYETEYDEETATEYTATTLNPRLKPRATLQATANRRSKVFNYI